MAPGNPQYSLDTFRSKGCRSAIANLGSSRPDIVLTHPKIGVICVSCEVGLPFEEQIVSLNQKIAGLRSDIRELEDLPIISAVVSSTRPSPNVRTGTAIVLQPEVFTSGKWIEEHLNAKVDQNLVEKVDSRLQPHFQFLAKAKEASVDPDAGERASWRFILDEGQATIAQKVIGGVLLITGPPGSGKTLVLAARAKWLSQRNPEWEIVVVTYNKLLALHISQLLQDYPNVKVSTFGQFSREQGHRISQMTESRSAEDVRKILAKNPSPCIDALLIDEWQDFHPGWMTYLIHLVRKGKGGITLAGDERQGLYRSGAPVEAFDGQQIEHVTLSRPYRSTRQILEITNCIADGDNIDQIEAAPDGPPVDLIFADSWDAQADVIAWEVDQMLKRGERTPSDIAVVGTRRNNIARLERSLTSLSIPFSTLDGSSLPLPGHVSILTVHKSKGYEFPVVFLMAIEALPKPEGGPTNMQKRRVGFVGPTRAQDQLILTYTRPNDMVQKLVKLKSDVIRHWEYPDDYEVI